MLCCHILESMQHQLIFIPGLRVFKPEPDAARHTRMNCLLPPTLTRPEHAGPVGFVGPLPNVTSITSQSLYYPNVTTCLPAVLHCPCQSAASLLLLSCPLLLSSPSTCCCWIIAVTEDVEATAAPPANMSVIFAHFAASTVRLFS